MNSSVLSAKAKEVIRSRRESQNYDLEIEIDYNESTHEITINCEGSVSNLGGVCAYLGRGEDMLTSGGASFDEIEGDDFEVGIGRNDMEKYSGQSVDALILVFEKDGGIYVAAERKFQIP